MPCPDCQQVHAVLEDVRGRSLIQCSNCDRLWPPTDRWFEETTRTAVKCREHPNRETRSVCVDCNAGWCDACSRRVQSHLVATFLSPCCRDALYPVARKVEVRSFWEEIPAVLLYALRGGSLFVLAFLWFGNFVPILTWTIPIFAVAYGVHVTRSSAGNPYDPPNFPEPDDLLVGFLFPAVRFCGAALIAWSPWILYRVYGPEVLDPRLSGLFAILGLAVFPTILLAVIMRQRFFAALLPSDLWLVARSMGGDYVALMLALAVISVLWLVTGKIGEISDLLLMVMRFVRYYLFVTAFHLLGRSIWQTRDRIEWGI